jgi:prepilin-type N-terminal cleavage/methylation domain-containing protein
MRNRQEKGLTLVEILVVIVLFLLLLGAVFAVSLDSERSWRTGQDNIICQQQARRVVDEITRLIRQSSVTWNINGVSYSASISDQNRRLDFFVPEFDSDGNIASLRKITFKLDPDDPAALLKKEGNSNPVTVARNVDNIYFGAGCTGCVSFDCSTLVSDCPVVTMDIRTRRAGAQGRVFNFSLSARAYLRNQTATLAPETIIDLPGQGEF